MATEMFGGNSAGGGEESQPNSNMIIDIRDKIDMKDCYGRNVSNSYPMSNLFIGDSTLGCCSDTDEQMILHISFQEFVKIRSIQLIEFNNGINPENNPMKIHLYVNRENMGFEDIDDIDPTQTIEIIDTEQCKNSAEPILLKYVKYQRVKSLTIYIEENHGGDITTIGSLKLFGQSIATVNMNNFKAKPDQP